MSTPSNDLPSIPPSNTMFPKQAMQQIYCPMDEEERLEDIERYRPGGFHPIMPGEFLGDNARFDVWNKLGQGAYGIVWLCFDNEKEKFCAVKVLRDDVSNDKNMLRELRIKEMLQNVSGETAWENHVALPLEHFFVNGPNGRHLCMVMPLLGPDISDVQTRHFNDVPFLKDVCYQLTRGTAFLHKHGICHGDIRHQNALFKTTLGSLTTDEMNSYMPAPIGHEIWSLASDPSASLHAPKYAIQPMEITLKDRYITHDIAIIDFGVSFELPSPPLRTSIPEVWAAPENQARINQRPGLGADLWALGCTISEVLCGSTPFESWGGFSWRLLEEALGPIPEPYRARLINNKLPGIYSDHSDLPLPLLTSPQILEKHRIRRLERSGTDDFLYDRIGRKREFTLHPDWNGETQTLEPQLGKGWDIESKNDCIAETPKQSWLYPQEMNEFSTTHEVVLHGAGETDGDKMNGLAEGNIYDDAPMPQPIGITRQLEPAAVPGAVNLLKQVLRWLPEDRVPAEQLLDHEWFEGRNKKEQEIFCRSSMTKTRNDRRFDDRLEERSTKGCFEQCFPVSAQATHAQVLAGERCCAVAPDRDNLPGTTLSKKEAIVSDASMYMKSSEENTTEDHAKR